MAQASPSGRNRPLSPHLQIWRWGPAMAVSILHRVTGNGLAVAGLGVLLWWLGALASGPAAYATFTGHASAWYGMVVLVGISWAFFNHMASGIRHFFLDVGANFELNSNALWSVLTPIIGILLTAAFWAALLLR
ncbi:succinate dehydrogenase, cytochrome b556 subunit [Novosphingobium sp. JCM 18896]|uniref:succinate dehydrogenase, cytochrome b556 subunit n=1 Tax=Novosphingobium sp. JCM 18896 TaxID=2989731 RepID=UPI0022224AE3|nr:succinate dehydrogenase, cytochrome b556 subunit [Novosphingobium sp. JCM 18896]MCW1431284.1 succinate dehydrogenase, cytochrome b556 subunit [Novosphingobium sp. JCM 18896]